MSPRVVVVGVGRVGSALALRLKAARWKVSVEPRSPAAVKRAKALKLPRAQERDFGAADLVVLAVPDAAVPAVAKQVVQDLSRSTGLVHCAGALGLDAFEQPDWPRASFHPLVAISDPKDTFEGGWVALAATDPGLMPSLRAMAKALKMHPFWVPEGQRAAYHAGAVMSAGLVVALLDAAAEASGLPRETAEKAYAALAASALRGAAQRGLAASLTGPIVRGDAAVVDRHLAALPSGLAELYRVLSVRALAMSKQPVAAFPSLTPGAKAS